MVFMLETERLILRPLKDTDLETILAYRNDPDVARFQGWDIPYSREKAIKWVINPEETIPTDPGGRFTAALELKSTGEMVGDLGILLSDHDPRQAHIGYSLAQSHWHKGYTTEACLQLLAFLFDERNMHRVKAETDVLNEPSWRLLERLGFRREAHFVENIWFKGAYASEYHYALLKKEWNGR